MTGASTSTQKTGLFVEPMAGRLQGCKEHHDPASPAQAIGKATPGLTGSSLAWSFKFLPPRETAPRETIIRYIVKTMMSASERILD